MDMREAVAEWIINLCNDKKITPNALSYMAGVPQSTIKSILNNESKNPGVVTIKRLCDGLQISIPDFFNTDTFRNLEQEIE